MVKISKMIKSELDAIRRNANLTQDELVIFEMLAGGSSLVEISVKTGYSDVTIGRRIRCIREKIERCNMIEVPVWEKVALTKEEAAAYSNIGINTLERLLREPRCPFVLYIGKKKLIKRKEFEQFISDEIEI